MLLRVILLIRQEENTGENNRLAVRRGLTPFYCCFVLQSGRGLHKAQLLIAILNETIYFIPIILYLSDMVVIKTHNEFESHLGKELGVSNWHTITQEQINNFADATLDHQWIHTDPEKAKKESPFKTTIAHGYLTLSLIPFFWKQIVDVQNLKMEVNYGIERLKFGQAVIVGSEVRWLYFIIV